MLTRFTIPFGASELEFFAFPKHGMYVAPLIHEDDEQRLVTEVYHTPAFTTGMPDLSNVAVIDEFTPELKADIENFFNVRF